jgi:hypothetical protein
MKGSYGEGLANHIGPESCDGGSNATSILLTAVRSPQLQFYLSLPSLTISTISCVVIFALIVGTSKGEKAVFSGTRAKVLPSFLRISTFPVLSAFSRTKASFCRASEYV